jgi:hypothetical protein
MSFKVDPAAIRACASRLDEVERVAGDAQRYVAANGNFSFHESGIMGYASPGHRNLMANLQKLLTHLAELGVDSQKALRTTADVYQRTDGDAAARIDATYPPVQRPRPDMDDASPDPWHE